VGDAGDPSVMRSALTGADAVVHLAAIPGPVGFSSVELLEANSRTTLNVLECAGTSGVRTAVIASSVSALGMAWYPGLLPPLYLPVDESHPLRPAEGYALSKELDEASARMANRTWDITTVALRFPFTQTMTAIEERRDDSEDDTQRRLAKELWGYLDVRDAARAIRLALQGSIDGRIRGAVVLNIVVDDVCAHEDLATLMAHWHPGVQDARPQAMGAYDTSLAERLIGFQAEHRIGGRHRQD
jgi:nucleoside-diphosphate-sugar epimerase